MKATKLAAMALCAAMVATALVAMPARSGNTSNNLIESLACPYPTMQFYDVAWTPDGKAALFVGFDTGTGNAAACWWYPGNATWQTATPMSGYALVLRAVCYDPGYTRFVAVGDCTSSGHYFIVNAIGGRLSVSSSSTLGIPIATIQDMVFSNVLGAVLMAGRATSGTTGPVCYRLQGGTVSLYTSATGPYPGGMWYGVETYPSYNALYFVGTTGTGMSLVSYCISGATSASTFGGGAQASTIFQDVVFDPYSGKLFIAVAAHTATTKGLYRITLSSYTPSTMSGHGMIPTTNYFLGISVDKSGVNPGRMVLVGYNGTYGSIYDAWTDAGGNVMVAKRSDNSGTYTGLSFKAVAVRPSGQPFALVAGSAFKYYYTSAASGVIIDTAVPHIDYLDLYDSTATSVINSQVDVDSGTGALYYNVEVKTWHNSGQGNLDAVDAYLWHDGGGAETFPASFDDAGYENTRMHFLWSRSGGFVKVSPATDETVMDFAHCGYADLGDLKNLTVSFGFSPRQQVRYAQGLPGFVEPAGDRYGAGIEGQSTSAALDSLNSWNIRVVVTDVGGASVSAYDEFGFFRYTYIGSGGLPGGGSLYGSGPPSTMVYLSPNDQDVTYSANCPYQVLVSATDLWNVGHTVSIPASQLAITGGTMPGWEGFSAAGDYVWLVGTEPVGFQSPQPTGVTTTTSSADFNLDSDPFRMMCLVPAVGEDRYFGTVTFSVVHV